MLAAASGSAGFVLVLLTSGLDQDATNTDAGTALMAASRSNQIDTIEVLLTAHATLHRPAGRP